MSRREAADDGQSIELDCPRRRVCRAGISAWQLADVLNRVLMHRLQLATAVAADGMCGAGQHDRAGEC